MKAYYFTFPSSGVLRNAYVKVEAPDWNYARSFVVEAMGGAYFAFQYEESDFIPQIEKYKLSEIDLRTFGEFRS